MNYKKHVHIVLGLCTFLVIVFGLSYFYENGKVVGPKNKDLVLSKQVTMIPYLHGDNSFVFNFPSDMQFSNLVEGEGVNETETVIFSSGNRERSFQIYIASYPSTAPITIQLVAEGNPNLQIFDPGKLVIDGEQAVAFISSEKGSFANTREIWFTHQGKIYQISTYTDFTDELLKILSTLKWLE